MRNQPDAFRVLRILHLSLLSGLGLFTLVSIFITKEALIPVADESFNRMLQVVVVITSVSVLIIGFNIFKKKILAARSSVEGATKRMDHYRNACIIWWAMIESPGLFAVTGFLLTANHAFLFLALFHVLLLFVFMPRKENIILLLNLNSQEVIHLEGKE